MRLKHQKSRAMKRTIFFTVIISSLIFFSCGGKQAPTSKVLTPQAAFDSLIAYVERNGNFINSPQVPAMITAYELYPLLDSNILIIDTRTTEEFASAHIPSSFNLPFEHLLNYFEGKIDPNSFSHIVLVCNAGQTASYATSILRILGYNNVFALKWGFSSWHRETAEKRWLARTSNKYSELLEQNPNLKKPAGGFPGIETEQVFGYGILRERAHLLFSQGFNPITVTPDTLFHPDNGFYIINYWPEALYNKGHIPGAIQYQPKKSLKSSEQLNTLPIDRPVVVYCFTGQHSSFATAYLRLLGYDARTLTYGVNGFMHGVMLREGIDNTFTEAEIYNFPVSSGGVSTQTPKVEPVAVSPRGGC